MDKFSIALPLKGADGQPSEKVLNCTLVQPKLNTVKKFRQSQRQIADLNSKYAQTYNLARAAADAAAAALASGAPDAAELEKKALALYNECDSFDSQTFDAQITQAKSLLLPNLGALGPDELKPTFEDVDWENVDYNKLTDIPSFFAKSYSS